MAQEKEAFVTKLFTAKTVGRQLLGGILTVCAVSLSAAPKYTEFKPLDQVVKTPVANVASGAKTLPIITWGGDIATIYGNGGQRNTKPGSIFAQNNLSFRLVREDAFPNQVKNYLAGKTPYLRGTMGMLNSAIDVLSRDPRTKPVVFYQMTWSAGGDALVVKNSIKTAKDLRGKTIAIQAYGPHVDYLVRVLNDAGLSINDVQVRWLPDLTASDDSPASALYENDVDAAFVIIPDALALTSGGNVGTGAEDSVKGAKILMSTKTANRVIADVYAVRSDYYQANSDEVSRLAKALLSAEEEFASLVSDRTRRSSDYNKSLASAAELLLDSSEAIADTEGLYADCEFVHFNGNVKFFDEPSNPRNFERVDKEINKGFASLGLISGNNSLEKADLNYKKLASGLANTRVETKQRFKSAEVSALVTRKQQQGSLAEGELFSFEVFFGPNQNTFPVDLYKDDFSRVVELASTYGGAIITVEGHSDPMGYLRAKKKGQPSVVLGRIKQSAKNLSVSRAQSVQEAIIQFASAESILLDSSQFEPIGHGITQPNTGICGDDPCAPKNEEQWRSNMRVVFRIIQVEAESDVFMPL